MLATWIETPAKGRHGGPVRAGMWSAVVIGSHPIQDFQRAWLEVAADDLFEPGAMARLSLTPTFLDVGQQIAPLDRAEMRLTVAPASPPDAFPGWREEVPRTAASPAPTPRR